MAESKIIKGRFAPSPTGRMHLGNLFTALISWLSVRKAGGKWILRIEDLDPQRSRHEYARQIEDDLNWLGLDWDEGGLDNRGNAGSYTQSLRGGIYAEYLDRLKETGLTYPCFCTRADIKATQAPHQSDGRIIYAGTCRPDTLPSPFPDTERPHTIRIAVDDREIKFDDTVYGPQGVNLANHCGDFVLRRADGAWAYQLAVVVDDALMGVTEIVRGNDLLLSAAQQIYLYNILGFPVPVYSHLPLIGNMNGQRLSKRDLSLSLDTLRETCSPQQITGYLASLAGVIPKAEPCSPHDLVDIFSWKKIQPREIICIPDTIF